MIIFTIVYLAAFLHQSTGKSSSISSLLTTLITVQNAIVDEHNEIRRNVVPTASNMLKMKWNATVAANAQSWANTCNLYPSLADARKINGISSGENLYMSSSISLWSKAIQGWNKESKDFEYGKGAITEGAAVRHYTQVVWYKSSEIGCAYAYCPTVKYPHYFVCQYFPAGNIQSQINKPYKEGTPCGDCPNDCDNGLCTNPCPHKNKFSNCDDL
ncbi:cysteine-rich venom protein triflin-like [Rhinatrema bivittatum]|uniref:cysteine-rich venom protein triflin-like n=1 Tax=Rhinatrema bivittatum TaxID=194408 RepID=UPI00112BEF5F|nr:cysteine-rich venom protein triflin-like [Rhinatrema bivittatum]XP_029452887.1 cysteine-rich venom protein triflin-like [Rhinatrema bivittatum]